MLDPYVAVAMKLCAKHHMQFDAAVYDRCPECLREDAEHKAAEIECKIIEAERSRSALTTQVSGEHYKKLVIQPIEYIHANGIPFAEGSVIKYVTRWRDKGGIKDLEKARHFLDILIELETKRASNDTVS